MLQTTLDICIFGALVFMLFFVLGEKGEREEDSIKGASYEELTSDYSKLAAEHEREALYRVNLESKVERYYSLSEITARASFTIQEEELCEFIAAKSFQLIGYGRCSIMSLCKNGDLLVKAVSGFAQKGKDRVANKYHISDPIYQWVFKNPDSLIVKNLAVDKRFSSSSAVEEGSIVCVPLFKKIVTGEEKEIEGILEVRSPIPEAFKIDDLRLLTVMADLLTISVENIRLYNKTQEFSIRDGLTHLYLHRYFQEQLEEELKRASFYKLNLSVMVCDIDSFKRCNDTYGHTFGDLVLKEVAVVMMSCVRGIDIVARYGGDEFVIVLPETPGEGARIVAERIRKGVEDLVLHVDRQEIRVTISIGVASYPSDGPTKKDELVAKADEALLKAKNTGKNRVC